MLIWKCLHTIRILTFKLYYSYLVTAVLMFRKFQRIVKYFSTNVTNFFIFLLVSLLFRTSFEFLFRLIFALPLELNLFNTTGNRNIIDLLQWSWSWRDKSTRGLVTALELLELTIEYPLVIFVTSSTLFPKTLPRLCLGSVQRANGAEETLHLGPTLPWYFGHKTARRGRTCGGPALLVLGRPGRARRHPHLLHPTARGPHHWDAHVEGKGKSRGPGQCFPAELQHKRKRTGSN